jgi:hypothetical protein
MLSIDQKRWRTGQSRQPPKAPEKNHHRFGSETLKRRHKSFVRAFAAKKLRLATGFSFFNSDRRTG